MFDSLGWGEIAVLLVLALFVFGPERLPALAADAGRLLRQGRQALTGVTDDLRSELGPELGSIDLAAVSPRALVQKHLLDDLGDLTDLGDGEEPRRAAVPPAGLTPPYADAT